MALARIGYTKPPFCSYVRVTRIYGACFYVEGVMDEPTIVAKKQQYDRI